MNTIDWASTVRALLGSGLTQPQLAQLCGCGQATISDVVRGKTTDPRTSLGLRLIDLARQRQVAVAYVPAESEARDAA